MYVCTFGCFFTVMVAVPRRVLKAYLHERGREDVGEILIIRIWCGPPCGVWGQFGRAGLLLTKQEFFLSHTSFLNCFAKCH